ncbi:SDR family oxidoreductase [Acidimicrobiaceae bacterium USS-CC1]|uniref:SDR family oxidoreductase n=1 Tax=Acidiferrimicrobium australe TaxID=2664430 RepID=A0ABW9QR78_9ACTN|nr:SDR family oxidoreductase [Acidiferrimicrobium australe]
MATAVPVYPDLSGKVAVVTGGSRGIGAATVRALARNGAAVAAVARDREALAGVVATVGEGGGRAAGVVADCTDEHQLARAVGQIHDQLGVVDILAAFAGGDGMPVPTGSETAEHWRHVVDNELTSCFLTVSAFLPDLTASPTAAVITMSSAAGRQAAGSSAAYAAAKAGVVALSRHLASELAPYKIRVNCIAPSAIENDKMRVWVSAEQRAALATEFPLGRLGQPDDVANAAAFLASQASSWITGITLDVAGGKIML